MDDFYNCGVKLQQLHPDPKINDELVISELCAKLDTARRALGAVAELNLITPKAVAVKRLAVWALEETHPKTLGEHHSNHG